MGHVYNETLVIPRSLKIEVVKVCKNFQEQCTMFSFDSCLLKLCEFIKFWRNQSCFLSAYQIFRYSRYAFYISHFQFIHWSAFQDFRL